MSLNLLSTTLTRPSGSTGRDSRSHALFALPAQFGMQLSTSSETLPIWEQLSPHQSLPLLHDSDPSGLRHVYFHATKLRNECPSIYHRPKLNFVQSTIALKSLLLMLRVIFCQMIKPSHAVPSHRARRQRSASHGECHLVVSQNNTTESEVIQDQTIVAHRAPVLEFLNLVAELKQVNVEERILQVYGEVVDPSPNPPAGGRSGGR